MTNKKVHTTDAEIWNASGVYSFRTYKNSTLTFKADDYISAIEFDGISVLFNEIEFGKVWVGNTDSITFTATGRCIISTITLTIGEPANAWIPDTVTVPQARALIEANDTLDHFVKGIVASQPFNTYDAFSGRVNFYMVDDLAATDSLLACQVYAGQQLNASQLELVRWASLEAAWEELRIGDTILVYANALNLNATNIYQIESGFYDSKLGANPNPPAIDYPAYDTITVAEALGIAKQLTPEVGKSLSTDKWYVVGGYVTSVRDAETKTYYMADEMGVYAEFQAYKCYKIDATVNEGDYVFVRGQIVTYNGAYNNTYEIYCGTLEHAIIASDTQVNGIWYIFNNRDNTASVTYKGDNYFSYTNEYSGSVTIPASINYNNKTYRVTSIGGNAFSDCTGLTSIEIPNSVTRITGYAFSGCTGLTSIEIPNSVTNIEDGAFYHCSGLTSVTIGNSVISIGLDAFNGCTDLTSVTIPNSVISIGEWAFNGCRSLNSVTIGDSATSIKSSTFSGCTSLTSITIGNNVTSIGSSAFWGCAILVSIEIPNSVTSIGDYAFANCKNLNKVTILADIPPTLKTGAFKNAASDLSIYVPCGTFETYQSAWSEYSDKINYPKLEYTITGKTNNEAAGQVIVPQTMCDSSITAMPNNGYYFVKWSDGNTDNPRTIVLTQDTTFTAEFAISKSGVCGANNALTWSWDDTSKTLTISENGALTENYTFGLEAPTQLQKLVVGNEVTAIGDSAFYGMKTLTRMTLGNGLESIGKYAFMNCSKLTEAVIPASVMTIGKGAFMNGNRLQKITLGGNIETIEASAFANCPYLLEVQAKMEFPPIIDASVFADCGDLSGIDCYVPEESMAFYKKTAVWKEFHLLAAPEETPTDLEQVGNKASTMIQKILRDGQILILRGDKTYTITGQEVR